MVADGEQNMEPPCPARCALQPQFSGGKVNLNNFEMGSSDIEELLAERGIQVLYETVRRWYIEIGSLPARKAIIL